MDVHVCCLALPIMIDICDMLYCFHSFTCLSLVGGIHTFRSEWPFVIIINTNNHHQFIRRSGINPIPPTDMEMG